jgi:Tfp pilus assembly protein PilN
MGQEIRWSYVLNDLSFKLPANLWLTSMSAAETTAGGTATATSTTTPTTLSSAGTTGAPIGTVSFSVTGRKHDDIAAWLDALSRIRGFADPAFQSSTEATIGSTPVVNAGTTVDLTPAALSSRYTGSGN